MKKYFPSLNMVINGNVLATSKETSVEWIPGLTAVVTSGGRGYSTGSKYMTFSGTLAIPQEGPDFNPTVAANRNQEIDVQVFAGPLSLTTKAIVMTASAAGGPESETTFSYTLEADFAEFA